MKKVYGNLNPPSRANHKDARFEVFQYDDGSKELWITPPGTRRYPGFMAPADEPTLRCWRRKASHMRRGFKAGISDSAAPADGRHGCAALCW